MKKLISLVAVNRTQPVEEMIADLASEKNYINRKIISENFPPEENGYSSNVEVRILQLPGKRLYTRQDVLRALDEKGFRAATLRESVAYARKNKFECEFYVYGSVWTEHGITPGHDTYNLPVVKVNNRGNITIDLDYTREDYDERNYYYSTALFAAVSKSQKIEVVMEAKNEEAETTSRKPGLIAQLIAWVRSRNVKVFDGGSKQLAPTEEPIQHVFTVKVAHRDEKTVGQAASDLETQVVQFLHSESSRLTKTLMNPYDAEVKVRIDTSSDVFVPTEDGGGILTRSICCYTESFSWI